MGPDVDAKAINPSVMVMQNWYVLMMPVQKLHLSVAAQNPILYRGIIFGKATSTVVWGML
jgi:hypothetical protein